MRQFTGMKPRELLAARHARLLAYGRFKNTTEET
jgi:acetyl-CoA carboxylase carboxyl transferase subunit alpha